MLLTKVSLELVLASLAGTIIFILVRKESSTRSSVGDLITSPALLLFMQLEFMPLPFPFRAEFLVAAIEDTTKQSLVTTSMLVEFVLLVKRAPTRLVSPIPVGTDEITLINLAANACRSLE